MSYVVPTPPLDAVMPAAQVGLNWAWAALAAASLVYSVVESFRQRSWLPFNIFLGAGLAMFGESLVIHSMHTWYPAIGQIRAYEAYGHAVPLFAALAYWFYFAPAILWLMKKYEQGMTTTQFWSYWGMTVLGVLAYELVGLKFNLWSYYGDQPFMVGKLPISWLFLNASAVMPVSVILFRLRSYLKGPPVVLVIPLMAAQVPGFEYLSGYPLHVALNSDVPHWATQLAALTSIAMSISLFWVCSKAVCVPSTRQPRLNEQGGR